MLLALLIACRCAAPEGPQELTFEAPVLREVRGRFRGQQDVPLDPAQAFAVQTRCPRITRARLKGDNPQVHEVTVQGEGLAAVTRVGAAMPDGSLANAQFLREDGALVFPVACTACEVYLGIPAGTGVAACIGPGYSLTLAGGKLVP